MPSALIQLEGVAKVYYTREVETHALDDIHLEIAQGEFIAIEGPSGCGKSTLLAIMGLLEGATRGIYVLDGKPVHHLGLADRARVRNHDIGFIFQNFNLIGEQDARVPGNGPCHSRPLLLAPGELSRVMGGAVDDPDLFEGTGDKLLSFRMR